MAAGAAVATAQEPVPKAARSFGLLHFSSPFEFLIRQMKGTLTLIDMVSKRFTKRTSQLLVSFWIDFQSASWRDCEFVVELGGAALAAGSNPLRKTFEAHRAADGKALRNIALELDKDIQDIAVLDALGDDLAPERMGKGNC